MNPLNEARLQIISTVLQMNRVMDWMLANAEELPPGPALFLGSSLITVAKYANTAIMIINAPTVEQPVMGRHCMFY